MPSFDVVSRLDHQEIDNAIGNAIREITTRYDFKGSDTLIEKKENSIIVSNEGLHLPNDKILFFSNEQPPTKMAMLVLSAMVQKEPLHFNCPECD